MGKVLVYAAALLSFTLGMDAAAVTTGSVGPRVAVAIAGVVLALGLGFVGSRIGKPPPRQIESESIRHAGHGETDRP